MTLLRSLPCHLPRFQPQMGQTGRKVALDGTQHQRGLTVTRQRHQLVKLSRFDPCRHLGIDRPHAFEKMGRDPPPPDRVATPDHHQPFRGDPTLPGSERARQPRTSR